VRVADLDEARARAVAERTGATVVSPRDVLLADVDLIAPCAIGDVIDERVAADHRAWAVCGGANHIAADDAAHLALHRRGVLFVPDAISSAGAVIDGIGQTVMGLADRSPLIDGLGATARSVLEAARRDARPPLVHALARARARLAA
jgi:leucine dehydrogenase